MIYYHFLIFWVYLLANIAVYKRIIARICRLMQQVHLSAIIY